MPKAGEFKGQARLPNARRGRVGITVSLIGHSAFLVAILFCFASGDSPLLLETIPISVAIDEAAIVGPQLEFHPGLGTGIGSPGSSQTPVDTNLASQPSVSQSPHPLLSSPSGISVVAKFRPEPKQRNSSVGPDQAAYLWTMGKRAQVSGGGTIDFVEDGGQKPSGLTVTRRADWQTSPVEDDKLIYSAPGSSLKLTTREVSTFTGFGTNSAFGRGSVTNFAGPSSSPGFGTNGNENSGPFGLTPALWGADATARSQRLDWTLVNLRNFGMTAFSYQNQVGRDFQPFGSAKNEFAIAGTSTMKAGGQVRVGPFGFGYAVSSLEYAGPGPDLVPQGVRRTSKWRPRYNVAHRDTDLEYTDHSFNLLASWCQRGEAPQFSARVSCISRRSTRQIRRAGLGRPTGYDLSPRVRI
jgi:hypothetical protein